MKIGVVFLGTGSMVPTRERNHSGLLISYDNEAILVDCGEGTQRQFRYAGISPTKITKVLITHWHGDHVIGLPGLIQTLGSCEYKGTLDLYGPAGSKHYLSKMIEAFVLEERININVHEISGGVFFENECFKLSAAPLKHSARCLGYSFEEKDRKNINMDYIKKFGLKEHPILKKLKNGEDVEWKGKKIRASMAVRVTKGRKITVIVDTLPCREAVELAEESDILICEATFGSEFQAKATEYMHLTSIDAATLAKKAKVKELFLTHFSQRYREVGSLQKEASKIFKNTHCAEDLQKIDV